MGDLGHGYRSFATLLQDESIGQTGLEDYLKRSGIKLSEVADATATLFVLSLIDHNTLLKDLHFGNTGLITEDTTSRIGMVDFGGVQDNFPQIDKLWILSFISELVQGNEAKQIELLMAAAMRSGETDKQELKQLLPTAKELVAKLGKTREQQSSESMIEVCEGLLADIYDNWPLPNSVRNFVESLRKVGREWGPHISSECQEKIGLYLFNHLMTSTSELEELSFFDGIKEITKETTKDEEYELASDDESKGAYDLLEKLPMEAVVWIKENNAIWQSYNFTQPFDGSGSFMYLVNSNGETKIIHDIKGTHGFIEFEDDEVTRKIRFEDL
jgi:hypothetical protein